MRIAIFSETFLPNTDGVVTRLCATLCHLAELGHDVLLVAPAGGPQAYAGAAVVGVPPFSFPLYPGKRFARPWPWVGRRLQAFDPDVIHAVNPGFLSFAAIYYARRLRRPLVMSYHTHIPAYARFYRLPWLEPWLWRAFRAIHNQAAVNLCPSRATMADLEARGFERLALWERGLDTRLFSPAKRSMAMRRRLLGGAASGKVLLYVGRIAAEKGLAKLAAALDRLPDEVHLALVGDGPHKAAVERALAGRRVTFLGYLFGEELAAAYASADGFVFPSTTETLGLVLLEAMASGLPVMAADAPASREVLHRGRAGVLFHPDDPDDTARAMRTILYDDAVRETLCAYAQAVVQRLDWRRTTEDLVRHYEAVLAMHRAPMRPQALAGR
ncbi:glycosyl transferase [Alicyclobacillus cellulosilyticus]|uniref:Glycosyl transferase n=1 Tax=Alicyclobacillus cellulosilyticus TaxID=1003997 RepID=A0A917K281_9BACL|nr:glycosyltransferase family 1 protein [Alicyclobacillus cellulosilyticus]GGI98026.1 glycosyl transferase [Alicyclobacillus cellulosilyticus]